MKKATKREQEVLDLLTKEFLTPLQVAKKLKVSKQAVYKFIKKLREKGYMNWEVPKETFFQSTQTTNNFSTNQIRLHSQEWNIQILNKTKQYEAIRKRVNLIDIEGNIVRLYKDSIEIYSKKSFLGTTPQEATSSSMDYWSRFMVKLENELFIHILKPRYQNIKLVRQHYAETNNELAKEQERQDIKTKVYTTDDGKLWFIIDNSFNLHEAETTHPYTAKQDIEKITEIFNDIRDKHPPTISQLTNALMMSFERQNKIEYNLQEVSAGLLAIIKLLGVPNTSDSTTDTTTNTSNKEPPPSYVG